MWDHRRRINGVCQYDIDGNSQYVFLEEQFFKFPQNVSLYLMNLQCNKTSAVQSFNFVEILRIVFKTIITEEITKER